MWLSWARVTSIAKRLGIPTVPVVCASKKFLTVDELKSFMEREASRPSKLSISKQTPEGFVVRDVNNFRAGRFERHIAKYVRKDHIQTPKSRHEFKSHWKKCCLLDYDDDYDDDDGK